MKQVWITLKGTGQVYWFENFTEEPTDWDMLPMDDFYQMEDDGWLDGSLNECAFMLELESVCVSNDPFEEGEDITKKKGKYIKRDDVFKNDYKLRAPFYVMPYNMGAYIENTFCIELEDDEEFDPKQLQLIKSDYEVEFLPYGIVTDEVLYKGNRIVTDDCPEYKDKRDDAFICHEFYK